MKFRQFVALSALTLATTGSALAGDRGAITLTDSSPGHKTGSVNIVPLADGSFNDFFHFDAGDLRSISTDISSIKGVTWDSATLVDGNLNSYSFSGSGGDRHEGHSGGESGYFILHLQGHVSTDDHNSGEYNVHVSAVPEPETAAMLLAGLGVLGWTARRRQTRA